MVHLYSSFVQIMESDTLADAAVALHVTQPTLTRQLQQFERMLNMPLFNRVGKRLVVNRAGEVVYRYAKRLLAMEQKMKDELTSFLDPTVGTVYLGAGLTPSIYLLPQLLATYRKVYPDVTFQVRSGSSSAICEALLARELDVGIVTTVTDASVFDMTPLFTDDLLMVCAPESPFANGTSFTFTQVAASPMVLMRGPSGLRKIVSDIAASRRLSLNVAMETDSLESMNRLVQHGVGLSILPRSAIQDDLTAHRLVEVRLSDVTLGARKIMLLTRGLQTLPAVAEQFVRELPKLAGAVDA